MVTSRAIANIFDHFDQNLLTPYAVGFDRIFDRLQDHYALHQTNTGFPEMLCKAIHKRSIELTN